MADSTALYQADIDAVIAADLPYEEKIGLLQQFYSEGDWDDPDKAKKLLQEATTKVGYDSEKPFNLPEATTIDSIAAIPIDSITEEDPLRRINEWEKQNIEQLEADEDLNTTAFKPQFIHNIERTATSLRRQLHGKPTLSEQEEIDDYQTKDEYLPHELGRKALGGMFGGPLRLAGYDVAASKLTATKKEDQESLTARGLSGDIAAGVGYSGGLVATAGLAAGAVGLGVGAIASAPAAAIAATAAGAVGAAGYIIANAYDAINETFERSVEETGDVQRAYAASDMELNSQAVQALLGGKAVVGFGKRVFSRTLGKKSTEIATGTAVGAAGGFVGGGLSTQAQQIGADNFSTEGLFQGAVRGGLAGAGVGAGLSTVGTIGGQYLKRPSDKVVNPDNATPNPADLRTQEYSPDGSFAVTPDVLGKVEALSKQLDPEGDKVAIYINEKGWLVAKSPYLAADLTLTKERQDLGEVPIPVSLENPSSGPTIEASKVRAGDRGESIYIARFGPEPKSAGAASVTEFGKERRGAQAVRTDPRISERVRQYFGELEGPGLQRSIPVANETFLEAADRRIAEAGTLGAVAEFLDGPNDVYGDSVEAKIMKAMGARLSEKLRNAEFALEEAGDLVAAEEIAELAADVNTVFAARSGTEGGLLQLSKRHPSVELRMSVERAARRAAMEEVASEQKVSIEDLQETDSDIVKVTEELSDLSKVEDPEVVNLETLIKDIDSEDAEIQKDIDSEDADFLENAKLDIEEAQRRIEKLTKEQEDREEKIEQQTLELEERLKAADENISELQEQDKSEREEAIRVLDEQIADAKEELADLEADISDRENELVEQEQALTERIKAREKELATKEQEFTRGAERRKEDQVAAAESGLQKIKANPKSRVKPETLDKMEKNLAVLKEQESELSKQEQKALAGLKKDQDADISLLSRVTEKRTKEAGKPKEKPARFAALEKSIQEKEKTKSDLKTRETRTTGKIKKAQATRDDAAKALAAVKEKKSKEATQPKEKLPKLKELEDFISGKEKEITDRKRLSLDRKPSARRLQLQKKRSLAAKKLTEAKTRSERSTDAQKQALNERLKTLKERKALVKAKTKKKIRERLPRDQEARLIELERALETFGKDSQEARDRIQTEINDIISKAQSEPKGKLRSFLNFLYTVEISQMLSRGATHVANTGSNVGQYLLSAGAHTAYGGVSQAARAIGLKNVNKGSHILDGLGWAITYLEATRNVGIAESLRMLEGKAPLRTRVKADPEVFVRDSEGNLTEVRRADVEPEYTGLTVDKTLFREYPDAVTTISEGIKALPKIGGNKYLQALKYIGFSLRLLSAEDAIFGPGIEEANAWLIASKKGRAQDLEGAKLADYISDQLFNSDKEKEASLIQAREELAALKNLGFNVSDKDEVVQAWMIRNRKRDEQLRASAAYDASISYLNPLVVPRGIIGQTFDKMVRFINEDISIPGRQPVPNPGKMAFPFINVALKILNLSSDLTIGIGKGLAGRKQGEPEITTSRQIGLNLVGIAIAGTVWGMYKAGEIELYGPPPSDPDERRVRREVGIKDWSIGAKGKTVSFLNTPLSALLGSIAYLAHQEKYNKDYDEASAMTVAGLLLQGSIYQLGDFAPLRTLTDIMRDIKAGEDAGANLTKLASGPIRNIGIPGAAFFDMMERAYENPTSFTNNFYAQLFKGIPFTAYDEDGVALNIWGEEIKRGALERTPVVGSIIGRYIGLETADPNLLWAFNNGYAKHLATIQPKVTIRDDTSKKTDIMKRREDMLGRGFDDVLTNAERQMVHRIAGPRFKEVVDSYRRALGNNAYDPSVGRKLGARLAKIKKDVIEEVFITGAYRAPAAP